MSDQQVMERTVEQRECGALAAAVERGAFGELPASFNVGRRQRSKRARHLGKSEIGEMPRLESRDPIVERVHSPILCARLRDRLHRIDPEVVKAGFSGQLSLRFVRLFLAPGH